MRLFSFLLSIFFLHTELAAAEEYIRCRVSGNTATAYYCNTNSGGSASGKVDIDIYSENGSYISSSFCVGVATAVMGCSALCSVSAPRDAIDCNADVN